MASIVKPNGRNVHTVRDNAIYSVDHNGNKAKCTATFTPKIEINTDVVYEALIYTKELLYDRENAKPVTSILRTVKGTSKK